MIISGMTDVHILFRVDPPIPADKAVAGRRYQIQFKTGPARLTLPTDHTNSPTEAPTLHADWPRFPGPAQPVPLQALGGALWAASSVHVVPSEHQHNIQAMLCRAAVDDEVIKEGMALVEVAIAVSEWLSTVRNWLGAWTWAPQHTLVTQSRPDIVAAYKREGKWTRVISGGARPTLVMGLPLVSPEQLGAAFRAASAAAILGDDDARQAVVLPLEHQLLARAQLNSLLGDSRAAVIDSCCAAEVAMGKAVNRALKERGVDEAARDRMVNRTSGAVEMFRLYLVARESAATEHRIMDQLAGPRNNAAHGGKIPATDVVERSLNTSRILVEEASPLPAPAALSRTSHELLKARAPADSG